MKKGKLNKFDKRSYIERLFGKYVNSIIVGFIFCIAFLCSTAYFCISGNQANSVSSGLIGVLGTLAGFFMMLVKDKR